LERLPVYADAVRPANGGPRQVAASKGGKALPTSAAGAAGQNRDALPAPSPGRPLRFDETNLWRGVRGRRFNPSILADGDGYLFAVRDRFWWMSNIYIGRLGLDFRPIGPPQRLDLKHPDAETSREDPRLFLYRGRPHIAFMGAAHGGRAPTQNQLFARLSVGGMTVEEVFFPHYPARQRWEKNWSFFEHGGELFAVYSFTPCRILRIDGNGAALAHETPTAPVWRGGEIRGGASPVRVGDELWCFTHDRIYDGHLLYRTGLVTLDGRPPFAVRRMVPEPILTADRETKPTVQYSSVVFAGGAVRRGPDWIVAHGIHDHWSELHSFSHADLESRLVPVPRCGGR
jgi:hypothetical protein